MKDFEFKKLYYSISEVSRITGLEQHVLRYWESQFEALKPSKNRAGNRIYTNKDINLIFEIKHLVRDEGFTIEGARKALSSRSTGQESKDEGLNQQLTNGNNKPNLEEIKSVLIETRSFLEDLVARISSDD
ncbi:MAG: MerR family transcriptional regulator [Candidatus Kryptoniota bacterium]